jgi:glycosyltransferase involved in cell wall biosynthesis
MRSILILTPAPDVPGGVANYYATLKFNQIEGIDYFYVGSKNSELISFPLLRFFRFIKYYRIIKNYEVVLVNPSLDFKGYCRDSIYICLAKNRNKKVITFFRGWDIGFEQFLKKHYFFRKYFKNTFGKTDEFIVLGKVFENSLKELISPEVICHIESTVATDTFLNLYKPIISRLDGNFNLLFLGRIVKRKGIQTAIDIVKEINKDSDRVTLHVLGDGPDLNEIKAYSKEHKIIFHGYLKDEEKYRIISKCHILLFPTLYKEGLPNAILESMLFGLPIFSTRVAGIPDVLKEGENGFIINPENLNECVEKVINLIDNKSLLIKISEKNHLKAIGTFVPAEVRKRLLTILHT